MLKNYLKIAWRNLRKHRAYSLLNIAGLAIGMAGCVLLLLFVEFHASYDVFHANRDRIYRLVARGDGGVVGSLTMHAGPLAPALAEAAPEVEAAVRFRRAAATLSRGDRRFAERVLFTDPHVFEVFSFPLAAGDPETALAAPYSLVLAPETAAKLFGGADPLGQTLLWDGATPYKVTGVLREVPENSHISVRALASWNTLTADPGFARLQPESWQALNDFTYLLLRPGYAPDGAVAARVTRLYEEHVEKVPPAGAGPVLQPLMDVYTNVEYINGLGPIVSSVTLYMLAALGGLLLLVSCCNYMNLATARAAHRGREVGLRKVIGARRGQLMGQFLGESLLVAAAALLLALGLIEWAQRDFGAFAFETPLELQLTGGHLAGLAALVLGVGLLAGAYPALALSAFQPAKTLKGAMDRGGRGRLRKGLVGAQFAVAVFLLVSTGVMYGQMRYAQHKDLGFDRELVYWSKMPGGAARAQYQTLRERWLQDPRVTGVTRSSTVPYDLLLKGELVAPGQEQQGPTAGLLAVAHDFFDFYGAELVAGRFFSRQRPTDASEACIVNETALAAFGLGSAEAALGRQIRWRGPREQDGTNIRQGRIVGVVADSHWEPLYFEIKPLIAFVEPESDQYISVKIAAGDLRGATAAVARAWEEMVPGTPADFKFLDEWVAEVHAGEERAVDIFLVFAALAVFVTCLGLLGLTSFTVVRRGKEVGVRKVLGASVASVALLLSGEFTRVVLVAVPVGWALAYVAMDMLLGLYAYRAGMAPEVFVAAGVLTLVAAWLTVGYQAVKAALADPVAALRRD